MLCGAAEGDIPRLFNRYLRLNRELAGPSRMVGNSNFNCRALAQFADSRIRSICSNVLTALPLKFDYSCNKTPHA